MKKNNFKKVVLVILIIGIVAFGVCEVVFPTQTQDFVNKLWAWVNQPLPIVGFSLFGVGVFLYKVISMTTVGNAKINEYKELAKEAREKADKEKEELLQRNKELEEFGYFILGKLQTVCSTIKNVKINDIGKELEEYVKERTNNEETTK